jgi:hypothetical protein
MFNDVYLAVASMTKNLNYFFLNMFLSLQVVSEALRLYPLTILERLCVKDYKIPGVNFVVPKGMLVQIAR